MGRMTEQNRWDDVPQIHPSEIRVGDVIGTVDSAHLRYKVKLIGGPKKSPRQWTFFGRDDRGLDHASTFGEDELVHRYVKAS